MQHFRRTHASFAFRLTRHEIVTHSTVIGELAMGNLSPRCAVLRQLRILPAVRETSADETLAFLEMHRLFGLGIGWSDVQMLAAAKLNHVPLWTLDLRLQNAAQRLAIHHMED